LGAYRFRLLALGSVACFATVGGTHAQQAPANQQTQQTQQTEQRQEAQQAQDTSSVGLSKIETPNLRLLYYDPIQTYLTPYIGRAYENSYRFQNRVFEWKAWDKPTVYLRDLSDHGRATVRATPNNQLTLDIAPVAVTFETFSPGERFFTLMNHELPHIAHLDAWNDTDAWWRRVFSGKPLPVNEHPESILYNYLTAPRTNVPRWYLEGSAVFMETWMGGGLGRAQGAYDEMVFRAMVRDNAHFYDPLGLESEGTSVDFQVGANDYLYGTRFYSYLALNYSPEKVVEWLKRGANSDRYYSTQFERVFGKPLSAAWQDWIQWEKNFQRQNLAEVQKFAATPTQRLTTRTLGSVSRSFYDPRTQSLIAGFRYVGQIAHLGVLSLQSGEVRHLTNIKGPALYRVTSLAYDRATNTAYFTNDNNAYRDLMEVNVATGETRMLIEDGRTGDIVFNPADRSLWGIRHLNGLDTLVRVGVERDMWKQVHTFAYGHALFDLDISPDGQLLLASVGEVNGDQRIDVYRISDLTAGNVQAIATMTRGAAIPEGGAFSPDGRYVYATAYYTGVSNVYRLEIATGKVEAVSNAVTGFFRPIPMSDGSLIVYEYTGSGFSPVKIDPKPLEDLGTVRFLGAEIAEKHPVVKTWAVGSPAQIPFESMIAERGPYEPIEEMRLAATYPMVQGYKAHPALGFYVLYEDPMLFNQLSINVAYSPSGSLPTKEEFHGDITYRNLYWKVGYWHNRARFYDLFGPTDNSRKGDAFFVGYNNVLIYDPPRQLTVYADLETYFGLDTLPGAQNVRASSPNVVTAKGGLIFTDVEHSLGAVDHEEGYRANIEFRTDYGGGEAFPKIRGGFDFGFALPWNHTSVWLYNSAGAGGGSSNSVLGYFYFGAFGNNYVDDGEVKRYRNYDSVPGFSINAIRARSFVKSIAELNLPPVRFSDIGTPGLYLGSARTAVFAGAMAVDSGHDGWSETYKTAGLQIDWNFTVAVRLPMVFSIGYAHGWGGPETKGRRDEVMVSLKIL
jgi:hypothetical protein